MKVLLQFRLGNIAVSSSFFFFLGGGPVLASLYESSHCFGSELGGPHFLQTPIYHILCTKYHILHISYSMYSIVIYIYMYHVGALVLGNCRFKRGRPASTSVSACMGILVLMFVSMLVMHVCVYMNIVYIYIHFCEYQHKYEHEQISKHICIYICVYAMYTSVPVAWFPHSQLTLLACQGA